MKSEPQRIGDETLARLKPGETRRSWVLAVFGAPDRRSTTADGHTEIWQYDYQPSRPSQRQAPRSRSKEPATPTKPATGVVYVELTRGVVSDWWQG